MCELWSLKQFTEQYKWLELGGAGICEGFLLEHMMQKSPEMLIKAV